MRGTFFLLFSEFDFMSNGLNSNYYSNWEQVIVSGKLRAQRAKSMKFKDGYMISSGQPVKDYIDSAVRHVLLRQVSFWLDLFRLWYCGFLLSQSGFAKSYTCFQGVIGIKVKIMLDWDPKGKQGPKTPIPDIVTIHPPKDEEEHIRPAAVVDVPAPTIPVAWTVFNEALVSSFEVELFIFSSSFFL